MASEKQEKSEQTQSESAEKTENPRQLNSEMAQAFQEIAQGERTAAALESKLDGIHRNLDQLLAQFEDMAQTQAPAPRQLPTPPSSQQ